MTQSVSSNKFMQPAGSTQDRRYTSMTWSNKIRDETFETYAQREVIEAKERIVEGVYKMDPNFV